MRVPIAAAALVAPIVAVALVSADNSAQLFSSYDPVVLRLEAPFTDLFAHPSSPDYSVRGTLSYTDGGRVVSFRDAGITVRGHTSRNEGECSFPKLKVDFDSKADGSTLLGGMKSVKIGTHCGESNGDQLTERYGRLPNQQSPLREAFVYRLLDVFGVPTLRARPARITYIESNAKPPLERNAVIVEGEGDAVRRLGGSREIPPEQFTTARAMFSTEDAVTLAFAEAMIGNFDWCLKFFDNDTYRCDERRKLWNVMAIATDDGGRAGARPLIYDFDIAGMVTGRHKWFADVYNTAFSASRSPAELEVLGQVQRTRSLFSRAVLDAARAHFAGRKSPGDADRRGRPTIDPGVSRQLLQRDRVRRYVLSPCCDGDRSESIRGPGPRADRLPGARRDSRRHADLGSAGPPRRHDPGRAPGFAVEMGAARQVRGRPHVAGLDSRKLRE